MLDVGVVFTIRHIDQKLLGEFFSTKIVISRLTVVALMISIVPKVLLELMLEVFKILNSDLVTPVENCFRHVLVCF